MKLINQSFEIVEQSSGLEGMYKQIELVGRCCTKSEDKITEGSAEKFIDNLIKLKHGSPLEHGTVYLQFESIAHCFGKGYQGGLKYLSNPYSKVVLDENKTTQYVTTNYRVLIENNWLNDLKYLCEPTEFHEKRICVKFICDRVTGESFLRHRVFSFARESTRYCNYSKDKFNNEITYILPPWISETDVRNFYENSKGDNFLKYNEDSLGGSFIFLFNLEELEETYITLVKEEGWKPQQARTILPFCIKSPLIMTGFISDWKGFFELRSNKYGRGGAHPQADELATPLYEEFKRRGYI